MFCEYNYYYHCHYYFYYHHHHHHDYYYYYAVKLSIIIMPPQSPGFVPKSPLQSYAAHYYVCGDLGQDGEG